MKEITAYKIKQYGAIKKGELQRTWMDLTIQKYAYGCLPLIIANQMGWDILCETSFRAIWNGNDDPKAISIKFAEEENPDNIQVVSHFGFGVLTFHPGFLFKTESDHNLYIKGVPNLIKDAIQALEGIVETDWLPFTFTMNWKFTRPNTWVEFSKGEPIARVMPVPRNYIEDFHPVIKDIKSNPELAQAHQTWVEDRAKTISSLKEAGAVSRMERNYIKGVDKNAKRIDFHQKKIELGDFNDNDLSNTKG